MLRRSGKPVIIVVNKADNQKDEQAIRFLFAGLGTVYAVSSLQGLGLGDLLDEMISHFDRNGCGLRMRTR